MKEVRFFETEGDNKYYRILLEICKYENDHNYYAEMGKKNGMFDHSREVSMRSCFRTFV